MGNHDVWCSCRITNSGVETCENCLEDERQAARNIEEMKRINDFKAKERKDQFMKDLEDPEFYSRVCQRLGIHAGLGR